MRNICLNCQDAYVKGTNDRGRCPTCATAYARTRGTTTQRGYGHTWQQAAREQIKQQPWCSVCGDTADLTADHVTAIAHGGTTTQRLDTLCRRHNSSKGGKTRRAR